jgi:hypothetical protein
MATYREGETKAARERLAQAAKLLDSKLTEPERFPTFDDFTYDHDVLIAWLLHREAKTLIEGK